jgi:hypothetical protein
LLFLLPLPLLRLLLLHRGKKICDALRALDLAVMLLYSITLLFNRGLRR